jgi:hypothetical protein
MDDTAKELVEERAMAEQILASAWRSSYARL